MCVGTGGGLRVVAAFDGGAITADAGALLRDPSDQAIGLMDGWAACFADGRNPDLIEHTVAPLLWQRVFGIALGYEDLKHHDQLRDDPVMAVVSGKRVAKRLGCMPLVGNSTPSWLAHVAT